VSAAELRALGGRLELGGDLLIGADGRHRRVPDATVGVLGFRAGFGQGGVSPSTLGECRGVVHRRADERVPEAESPRAGVDEACSLRRVQRFGCEAERGGGAQNDCELTVSLRGCEQQSRLRGVGQPQDPLTEGSVQT